MTSCEKRQNEQTTVTEYLKTALAHEPRDSSCVHVNRDMQHPLDDLSIFQEEVFNGRRCFGNGQYSAAESS
jgi:hypothetical protein